MMMIMIVFASFADIIKYICVSLCIYYVHVWKIRTARCADGGCVFSLLHICRTGL